MPHPTSWYSPHFIYRRVVPGILLLNVIYTVPTQPSDRSIHNWRYSVFKCFERLWHKVYSSLVSHQGWSLWRWYPYIYILKDIIAIQWGRGRYKYVSLQTTSLMLSGVGGNIFWIFPHNFVTSYACALRQSRIFFFEKKTAFWCSFKREWIWRLVCPM